MRKWEGKRSSTERLTAETTGETNSRRGEFAAVSSPYKLSHLTPSAELDLGLLFSPTFLLPLKLLQILIDIVLSRMNLLFPSR